MVKAFRSFSVIAAPQPPPPPPTFPPPPPPTFPPPPPPNGIYEDLTALYLPLYSTAMWTSALQYNPMLVGFRNLFTANPGSGPFTSTAKTEFATPQNRQTNFNNMITLKEQNPACRIIGYIATGNGRTMTDPWKTIDGIKAQVDAWAIWNDPTYGGIPGLLDGVMWDEADATPAEYNFYVEISNYARSRGLTWIRGNPGTAIKDERLVNLFDQITFSETSTLLPESGLHSMQTRTFYPNYSNLKFNYLAHTIDGSQSDRVFTADWFQMAIRYVGSIYITDQPGPPSNPWAAPSSFLPLQVEILRAQLG